MVLVSVCMSAYNHDKYVADAIESVLNQTYRDLELVIVDDCSTDNTKAILEKYKLIDNRIRVLYHDKNQGIATTANDSINAAKGKLISFIGSDDTWALDKLERQIRLYEKNKDKVIWSDGEVINSYGEFTGEKVTKRMSTPPKRTGNLFQELLCEDYIFGQSVLFSAELAKAVSFDSSFKLVNDHLYFVNLAKIREFAFMPEALANYRVHGANTSLKNKQLWFKERILIRKHFLEKFKNEILPQTRSDIYYKMAHAFSGLGNREQAKRFYFMAIRAAPFHTSTVLYLMLVLTDGQGFAAKFFSKYYYRLVSLLNFK